MIEKGFPLSLQEDVDAVLKVLPRQTYGKVTIWESRDGHSYTLPDGERITFPYRVYCREISGERFETLSPVQKLICHAIYTRSCDGYVREKHLRAILSHPYPQWLIPYLVKPADEYVLEILELLYESLKDGDNSAIREFWKQNIPAFLYSHARMISYWDVFHREKYPEYRHYVGKALFEECFGYTRSLEKLRPREKQDEA